MYSLTLLVGVGSQMSGVALGPAGKPVNIITVSPAMLHTTHIIITMIFSLKI